MADYDRYSKRDWERDKRGSRDWDRERNQFQDRSLDDRTQYGMGSPGGYSGRGGGVDRGIGGYGNADDRGYGAADRAYQGNTDYGRDDQSSSNYGGYEDRSFADEASNRGGYYGSASGGQDAYGGNPYRSGPPREQQTNQARNYGRDNYGMRPNYDSGGFGGRPGGSRSQGRESYAFNPYQGELGPNEEVGWGAHRGGGQRYGGDRDRGFLEKAADTVQSWFGGDDRDRTRGQHAGRGPKGYRRSDDRIREDISDRLADDSWLDASDIEVIVADCEVTLVGTVPDRDSKRRAESLAEDISGVKHVQNNLRVSQLNRATSDQNTAGTMGAAAESDQAGLASGTLNKQAIGRA